MNKRDIQELKERRISVQKRLEFFSENERDIIFSEYSLLQGGLSEEKIEENRDSYGTNKITKERGPSIFKRLFNAFINPFSAILLALAIVSIITDVVMVPAAEANWITFIIIVIMVGFSGAVRFIQDTKSSNAAERLSEMVETTTCVVRDGKRIEIPLDEVVVGDIVHVAAGDIIPADLRIIKSKDLFIGQSAMTGESEPIEKYRCCKI